MEHKHIAIDLLDGHIRNYRSHPPEQITKLKASLARFQQVRSIVVAPEANGRYTILAGHGVVEAAQVCDIRELSCDVVPASWDQVTRDAYLVADNNLSNDAADDEAMLAHLLQEQQDAGFDLASMGSDEESLRQMLESLGDGYMGGSEGEEGDGGDEFDTTPEEGPTRTHVSELWQLGEHWLFVGDSTKREDVARLMQGEKAVLCHADPPYGMGKENEGIANDNLYREKLDTFQMRWWQTCRPHLTDNASTYIWGTDEDLWRFWYKGGLKDSERLTFRNEIVWDKESGQGMSSDQHRMYPTASERCLFFMLGEQEMSTNADNYWEGWEPIRAYLDQERECMGWADKRIRQWLDMTGHDTHLFSISQWKFLLPEQYKILQEKAQGKAFKRDYDDLKRDYDDLKRDYDDLKRDYLSHRAYFDNTHENMTDVWQYPRVKGEERYDHPTPKPVTMIERIIKSSSPDNSLVYEPFLGTGTTLIACERTGRRCVGMEIEPRYADICLRRYEAETGQQATLLERIEEVAHA